MLNFIAGLQNEINNPFLSWFFRHVINLEKYEPDFAWVVFKNSF